MSAQSPLVQAMKKAGKRGLLNRQNQKSQAGQQSSLGLFGMQGGASGGSQDMANPSAIAKAMMMKGGK